MLRLKNSDLTRENKELTERCEEANSALRVKGRAHDQARQQVIADRDKVIADAEAEAARIRQQARDDADQILKDTNLKAEAIDQLAREQAVAQARKMVQSATDETREIQNAHRLRLQDLKSRISEMEKTRGEMMDYLAKGRCSGICAARQRGSPRGGVARPGREPRCSARPGRRGAADEHGRHAVAGLF